MLKFFPRRVLHILFIRIAADEVIEIATEHDIYSVIEGNDLEVCVIVLSESVSAEFEVTAHLDYKCRSLIQVAILSKVCHNYVCNKF